MRKSDIWQAKQNPSYVRTESMYIDKDKPIEQMDLDELRRALCGKANGDVLACEKCEARCKFGRRIVELLKPVEMEANTVTDEKMMSIKKAIHARQEKSENTYLMAIASGDPLKWLIDHGREPGNSMRRLKAKFGDMTAEEAMAQLKAKGTSLTMYVHPAAKKDAVVENPAVNEIPETTPAPAVKAKLKVSAVEGEYFSYSLERGEKLCMTSDDADVHIPLGDIAAMCAEIVQAVEMLRGVH